MDKLFLDANIFFAATASTQGASRAIFELACHEHLTAVSNTYALSEARLNIEKKLGNNYLPIFYTLISYLQTVDKRVVTASLKQRYQSLIVPKDLPILVGAVQQQVNVLITLDQKDFKTTLQKAQLPFTISLPGKYLQRF